ncbi:MAG: cytochrome c [Anaerolineae bacterium]|nr:cytochrome c [Anaerolineae bacterium]
MLKRLLLVVTVCLVLMVLLAATVAAQGTGDPVKGKAAWEAANCKSCHGANGEGKFAGPRAGDGKTAADWIKQVRTPRANMPAYSVAQISDATLTDMWAYMQTLPKPASFTPYSVPVPATDPAGKQLWSQKRCEACHSNFGQGMIKTRFVDQNRAITTEVVLKQLRTPAKAMPAFNATQVTDAQAAQIAEFMKAQADAIKKAAAPAAPAPAAMPKTGGDLMPWFLSGLALLGAGAGLMWRRRR